MPPLRSLPPVKPTKTERTHEENQERAYIAASRRSDRSLEARVESARRASEIHKRRTGRSLRVTEQDVINEEMYEEEDDDLPMQYRRLTAHLQTSNAEFDRRLQSYLAHQMGMRAPLVANGQFDPSLPHFQLSARQFMNPSMMQMSQANMQNPMHQNPVMSRGMSYRQNPYPMHQPRPTSHVRAASIATPQDLSNWYQHRPTTVSTPTEQVKQEDRRMSLPVQNMAPPHTPTSLDGQADNASGSPPVVSRSSSYTSLAPPQNAYQQARSPQQQPTPPLPNQPMRHASFAGPFHTASTVNNDFSHSEHGPLSAALPLETKQILAADPSDFSVGPSHLDNWATKPQQPFYSYNPNARSKPPVSFSESLGGINQTLAPASHLPASIDTALNPCNFGLPSAATSDSVFSPFNQFDLSAGFDTSFDIDPFQMSNSGSNSGQVTPAEADWTCFVDGGAFDDTSVS